MSEKARGALFSALGDIKGLSVLDAFSGSGALAFEAISRGAHNAIAIDLDKTAYKTILKNIEALGLGDQVRAVHANVNGWSNRHSREQFDIIFCDPPYNEPQFGILDKLGNHLKPEGIYVLSWPSKEEIPRLRNLEVIHNKPQGDARLVFYRKVS